MVDLKVVAYFKLSLSTRNWDRAFHKVRLTADGWVMMAEIATPAY